MTVERPRRSSYELEIPAFLEDYSASPPLPRPYRTILTPSERNGLKAVFVLACAILVLLPLAAFDVPLTSPLLALVSASAFALALSLSLLLGRRRVSARLFPHRPTFPQLGPWHRELELAITFGIGYTVAYATYAAQPNASVILGLLAIAFAVSTLEEGSRDPLPPHRVVVVVSIATALISRAMNFLS